MSTKQEAEKRDSEGKCIVCNSKADKRKRGLCLMHYQRFLRAWTALSDPSQQEAFEDMLIQRGQLLATRRGKRLVDGEDEFAAALKEFQSTVTSSDDALIDRTVKEIVASAEELSKRKAPKEQDARVRAKKAPAVKRP